MWGTSLVWMAPSTLFTPCFLRGCIHICALSKWTNLQYQINYNNISFSKKTLENPNNASLPKKSETCCFITYSGAVGVGVARAMAPLFTTLVASSLSTAGPPPLNCEGGWHWAMPLCPAIWNGGRKQKPKKRGGTWRLQLHHQPEQWGKGGPWGMWAAH